ncbi:putative PUB domain-containing protein [Helianthus annuus]|uniref:PUB domain-containing protein n=1 Tax=Helianthus annuus TaxID=4232 RepID=A0A9K3HUT4_HELAN|nr:putative PUB domain-containing protein [Helianthus annuus]KAJ0519896.1 putative PUB domain-containing protein [Helianthus annuus]KAJ0528531.1 putative PUB domain-containing protein [Helianthus annuus]KAJ0695453.1 putative PUB domain-containing protein [Helianthus annuus]KAJ0882160.1 putative PUB domain-containing protein [Helianthus annuus]
MLPGMSTEVRVNSTTKVDLMRECLRSIRRHNKLVKAASGKVIKHEKACLNNQHVFIPFAFDTFGFLAPEAWSYLVEFKGSCIDDGFKVKRAFETLLIYVRNVARDPDEDKFRKIRMSNPAFKVSSFINSNIGF